MGNPFQDSSFLRRLMPYGQRVHHLPCTYLPSLIEHYNIASTSKYYLANFSSNPVVSYFIFIQSFFFDSVNSYNISNAKYEFVYPGNQVLYPDNKVIYPGNIQLYPSNRVVYPNNMVLYPGNNVVYPGNMLIYKVNMVLYPSNKVVHPNNKVSSLGNKLC